ncbi:MAG: DUF4170 domain-containing protein [Parvibaculum sp.]|uniref:DUF4170 domain-containing protein n=1 Tax=Parvibaculum sp. TaxID=2024848 RepID=UPI003C778D72
MPRQLLHLVFGGELEDLERTDFRDTSKLDIVGIFPDYASAYGAWKAASQRSVDNAHMRYFIVHLHRLLNPGAEGPGAEEPGTEEKESE